MAGNGGSGFQNGLITKDEIDVSTDHGSCKIQLTYGSVTKLAKEDGVDVLVVSAFPSMTFYTNDVCLYKVHIS